MCTVGAKRRSRRSVAPKYLHAGGVSGSQDEIEAGK
jgi:hypothetical protein